MEIGGKVAIVTGGASGLGAATVAMLIEQGAQVAIFDVDEERGEEVAKQHGCCFIRTNVFKPVDVDASIEHVVEEFGHPSILVNCAGVAPSINTLRAGGEVYPFDAFVRTIEVNLLGTALVSIRFAYFCDKNRSATENGVIINTSSIAAFDGQMGHIAYAASKAGVAGMTLPMARDLSEARIRVVTIAPGVFNTPLLANLPGADSIPV